MGTYLPFEFLEARCGALRQSESEGNIVENAKTLQIHHLQLCQNFPECCKLHTVSIFAIWAHGQNGRDFGIRDRPEDVTVDLRA